MKHVDLALRLLYCAFAPIVLAGFATQIPVGGIALGAGVATVLAVTEGQAWRERVGRVPIIGRVFRGPGKLGAYYREHPPRPLPYYVLYPVLLPYVVFRPALRAEWRLYRRSGVIAVIVLVATAGYEYLTKWRPEIGLGLFLAQFIATLVMQMLVTMIVIMPLVTTIVLAHARPRRAWLRTLAVLTGAGAILGGLMLVRRPVRSATVDTRTYLRSRADTKRTLRTLGEAAYRAVTLVPADAPEGMVHGAPLAAARAELDRLWKPDEVTLFGVWTSPTPVRMTLVLEVSKRHPPIAFAVDVRGKVVRPEDVPAAGRALLARHKLPP